jgi:outer membrane protein assembly factor BamD (BamD/ComL family)
VEQHGRLDPDYPVELARGVALYRAGHYTRALQAFDRHLRLHPDGPLAARAQRYARAAVAAEVGDPPSPRWLSF